MRSLRAVVVAALEDVAEAVFPAACRRCGCALPPEPPADAGPRRYAALWNGRLRRGVAGSFTLPSRLVCPRCARGLLGARPPRSVPGAAPLRCLAAFAPSPVLFDLLHTFKYESQTQLAEWFGAFLAAAARRGDGRAPILVPVPLHPRRLRARGFDQSRLLADAVARRLGSAVAPDLVVRVRDTRPQARMPHAARAPNVAGAFVRTARAPDHGIVGIVDDVVTTGATVQAVVAALGIDPARIMVLAVCHAGTDAAAHAGVPAPLGIRTLPA